MEPDSSRENTEPFVGRGYMKILQEKLASIAGATGFRVDAVEKIIHLLNLLDKLNSHPFLKGKLALKGGTALNLFIFDMPRLSIDIDVNYIGSEKRELMLADRPKIEQAVQAIFSREGFSIGRMPTEHAGGKWRLNYRSITGQIGTLEFDLNFMFRVPLWDTQKMDSRDLGGFQAKGVPVLNIHELAAGKLAALFARHEARDLFDVHQLLCHAKLNKSHLRTVFVVYGALNRKDWRTISLEDISLEPKELSQMLSPVLHRNAVPNGMDILEFAQRLVEECKKQLSYVFPFSKQETEFLNRVIEKGEIDPSLLSSDPDVQERIKRHPMLLWKAQNVRTHFGFSE